MELLTYAVRQKLLNDDPLLSYVTRKEPVPIEVIAESFRGYLEPMEDKKSELLVHDYPRMLNENVPVVVNVNEDGGYHITGSIPDTLLEAIALVHNIEDKEEIIRALVDYNMENVYGQTCEILTASLTQIAGNAKKSMMAIPPVIPVGMANAGDDMPKEGPAGDMPNAGQEDAAFTEQGDFAPQMPEPGPAVQIPEPQIQEPEPVIQAAVPEIPEPQVQEPEPVIQAAAPAVQVQEPEPAIHAAAGRDPFSDAGQEDYTAEADSFTQSIRNIYEKFIADLKDFGLDRRLGLQLA